MIMGAITAPLYSPLLPHVKIHPNMLLEILFAYVYNRNVFYNGENLHG